MHKKRTEMVECQVCGHQFDAVFFKEDLDANDVEYCVVCGGRDFKFIRSCSSLCRLEGCCRG